jgi:L,D-peptidoglycan transpeptidase YkuD (ErfK/YbiS/YcfS/YnhG family)
MIPIQEMILIGPTQIEIEGRLYECRIGRGGVSNAKQEGDLKTPAGRLPLRYCYFRPDRVKEPASDLKLVGLTPADGWCDDPADPNYNQPVTLPYAARHEKLWREDPIYDLVIPLGYNDAPVEPGKGSAIFLHLMREDGAGTEGCIALKREDLLALLPRLAPDTVLVVPSF